MSVKKTVIIIIIIIDNNPSYLHQFSAAVSTTAYTRKEPWRSTVQDRPIPSLVTAQLVTTAALLPSTALSAVV